MGTDRSAADVKLHLTATRCQERIASMRMPAWDEHTCYPMPASVCCDQVLLVFYLTDPLTLRHRLTR